MSEPQFSLRAEGNQYVSVWNVHFLPLLNFPVFSHSLPGAWPPLFHSLGVCLVFVLTPYLISFPQNSLGLPQATAYRLQLPLHYMTNWSPLGQAEARSMGQELHLGLYIGGYNLSVWTIVCYLPRCINPRSWIGSGATGT